MHKRRRFREEKEGSYIVSPRLFINNMAAETEAKSPFSKFQYLHMMTVMGKNGLYGCYSFTPEINHTHVP